MNCGTVYSHSENASVFKMAKFDDITKKIIPFFNQYPILGVKNLDFIDWCNIATLIGEKEHLNHSPKGEGLSNIKLIKDRMNTKRK